MRNCLFCDVEISESNSALEHVIPNALGGRLRTKNATCVTCNNRAGYQMELTLIKNLSFFSTVFDVPRHHAENQTVKFIDENSGEKISVSPGGEAKSSSEIKVNRREGGGLDVSMNAETREEAARLISKRIKKPINPEMLVSTVVNRRQFSFIATEISLANEDFSRSLVKIALTFSRLRDVSIASDSPSIQALKSNGSASAIVGWSSHKSIADSSVLPPLTHGLRLYSDGNGTPLICEVSFFEDIRFVALLLERCDSAVNEQYKYDLVACKSVDLPDGNLQNIHMQTSMIGKSTAPDDIAIVNMRYWMQHQKQLLIQRAIQTAAQEFAQNVHLGIDLGEARRLATEQTNSALAPYGLHLQGDLEIEPM